MSRQRRVAVASPQTRLAIARRGVRADAPHLAPADLERARRLYRLQRRRALTAVSALAVVIVGLPLLLDALPVLDVVRVLGVPVSWLAVAVLPYAVLSALALWALRRAEKAEDDAA